MKKLLFTDQYDSNKTITEYPSFIEVRGGDGTLLTAINDYYDLKKPFYGIAGGTVNFLMNTSRNVSPDATVLTLPVLRARITLRDRTTKVIYAFNDFVIGNFNAWATFDCRHKDRQLGTFKGSGIVISTAAGSTGMNKNNHGTTLSLDSTRWAVTGMQTNRRVNAVLKPSPLLIKCSSRGTTNIAADGTNELLEDISQVYITNGGSVQVIINDLEELQEKRQ